MAQPKPDALEPEALIPDEEHPDYVAGSIGEEADRDFTPRPDGPLPPQPIPLPFPRPNGPVQPPITVPTAPPIIPHWPIRWCGPVSGKYTLQRNWPPIVVRPLESDLGDSRGPFVPPIRPFNFTSVNVRVDVDRYYPQRRISIEVSRIFPTQRAHVIAEVDSDVCTGFNHRVITATIVFRDGVDSLVPGTRVQFTARRTSGIGYDSWTLKLLDGTTVERTYRLRHVSRYFDPVDIEVDRAANAGTAVVSYDTTTHPNRPASLPAETLTLKSVFQRAGFDAKISPNASVVPVTGTGANGTWSDQEMHNAMVTYWSRFSNRPQWAMWMFYAERHDQGRGLGGIMFDDIGPNHRQGTALFRDSFIQDVPAGDASPAAWRQRMEFWTAIHEMGHAFNLAHSWQKSLSMPGGDGPWIPLANEPEARSWMNYPLRVSGGQNAFFGNFDFRFSDDELVFMRHAPRRFVQMGNEDWFENHGFEAPESLVQSGRWNLELRPNREGAAYRFLEPVSVELKLTNTSDTDAEVDDHLLEEGQHFRMFIGRQGAPAKPWRPLVAHLHKNETAVLSPGESMYGGHLVSASTQGWLIDEPGFYKIQAAIDMGDEIIVSNVMRIYVGPPASNEEAMLADPYFTEEVGRAVYFKGAPALTSAHDTLAEVAAKCGDNPAACHAELAITTPDLTQFKYLDIGGGRDDMAVKASRKALAGTAKRQRELLLTNPSDAADTIGHIRYFDHLRMLDELLLDADDTAGSAEVLAESITVMKSRGVLDRVVDNAERRLKTRTENDGKAKPKSKK